MPASACSSHPIADLGAACSCAARKVAPQQINCRAPITACVHAGDMPAQCRGGLVVEIPEKPGRIQLFPAGSFAARDGRPGNMRDVAAKAWRMTEEDSIAVIAEWKARKTRTVVDYEHQTLNAEVNGMPAPAAGWITNLVFDVHAGLFADVEWTARAKNFIKNGEYRYISPVFGFDPKTGAVTSLHSAALTNNPALDGMMEAAARENNQPQEDGMKKELQAALAAFLALDATVTEDGILAALKDKKPLAELLKEKDEAYAALKEQAPDPEKFAPMELLKAQTEKVAELSAKVAELEKNKDESGLDAEITAALKDGRLPKSCETWARNTVKTSPAALKSYLDTAVPTAALNGMQTGGKEPESRTAALTDEEKYACRVTGVSEEDFLAQKAKEAN